METKVVLKEEEQSQSIPQETIDKYANILKYNEIPDSVDASIHFFWWKYLDYYQVEQLRLTYVTITLPPAYRYIRYTPMTADEMSYREEDGLRIPQYEFNLYMPYLTFGFSASIVDSVLFPRLVLGSWEDFHSPDAKFFPIFSNGSCLGEDNTTTDGAYYETLPQLISEFMPAYFGSNFNDDNGAWAKIPFVKRMKEKAGEEFNRSSVSGLRYWEKLTPEGVKNQDYSSSYLETIYLEEMFGKGREMICMECEETDG